MKLTPTAEKVILSIFGEIGRGRKFNREHKIQNEIFTVNPFILDVVCKGSLAFMFSVPLSHALALGQMGQ